MIQIYINRGRDVNEFVKKRKELGRPVEEIVIATGLTVDEVLNLK